MCVVGHMYYNALIYASQIPLTFFSGKVFISSSWHCVNSVIQVRIWTHKRRYILNLLGRLWSVYSEHLEENWLHRNGIALYVLRNQNHVNFFNAGDRLFWLCGVNSMPADVLAPKVARASSAGMVFPV